MSRCLAIAACLAMLAAPRVDAAERAAVRGQVVDENGQPLAGANVAFEGQRRYSATTDAKGEYGLLLPPARYKIAISMDGYRGAEFEYEIRAGDPNRLPTVDLTSHASLAAAEAAAVEGKFLEASALAREQRLDEAMAIYEKLRAERPDLPDAHYNVAVILAQRKEWAAAEEALREALEREPAHRAAMLLLSHVYQSSGRPDEATATLERLAAARPEDAGVQLNLAYLHLNAGRSEEARVALDRVVQLDPKNADAHYLLATIATGRSEFEKAVELLERYLELAPEDGQYRAEAAGLLPALRGYVQKAKEAPQP